MRHALHALGIDLLVQERILFQQRRLLRACAIESNGKSCDQEDDGEDPSCAKEKPAPVRTSLQHALAMHWSYRRICDRKGKIEFIGLGVLHSDGVMQICPHSRLPKTFERRRADAELCSRSPNSCRRSHRGPGTRQRPPPKTSLPQLESARWARIVVETQDGVVNTQEELLVQVGCARAL